jgi:hypothetical protein
VGGRKSRPDEVFTLTAGILAVDGQTAVVRAEVRYGDPPARNTATCGSSGSAATAAAAGSRSGRSGLTAPAPPPASRARSSLPRDSEDAAPGVRWRGAGQSAPVEPAHPPAALLRVSNPVMRLLLRSPAGGPMRKQFMVLRFAGRKTGRRYDIPVTAHRLGGELCALTDARWRHNFRGGADVEVTLDGHVTPMRGQLLDDPQTVAPI